ncbi:MAG: multiubiquitin domain-containing protein [Chloroflexota bacterium]|nr:multiubiquitin domain-containing protein [Chloroflexota bacterium]
MTQQIIHEPEFEVDIEGEVKPWDKDTITPEEVAALGGWDVSEGVVLVDLDDGTERTLEPGEVVKLRPGLGFSKKIRFTRGQS